MKPDYPKTTRETRLCSVKVDRAGELLSSLFDGAKASSVAMQGIEDNKQSMTYATEVSLPVKTTLAIDALVDITA